MIPNNPFKCIDLPYIEILNSFMLKGFADHNSNAAQIISFGIHKLTHSHTMTPFDAPGKQVF